MPSTTMADLRSIPLEVLLQITSYLTTIEYGCLRRTCRTLEAMLFGAFAREFFSKRQFVLMEFSIQALVDIAKSRLGPSLTHLIIHLERPRRPYAVTPAPMSHAKVMREYRYRAEYINHKEFITTGSDVEMLSDAIKHLPNLETIGIRDFDSPNRSRDNTAWHSYGYPTFIEQTHGTLADPNSHLVDGEYISHVFLTLLRAIGDAEVSGQSSKVTRFEVLLHKTKLPDQAFRIPDRFQAVTSFALSKLEAILLDGLSYSFSDFMVCDIGDTSNPINGLGYFLSRFLANLSALQHLRLNFQGYDPDSTERFLLWLANAKPYPANATAKPVDSYLPAQNSEDLPIHFPPPPSFQNLQNLDIGMAAVSESVLLTLYKNYKSTLRGVSLHKITLRCKHDTKVNLWARLCNKMAAADLQLHTLRLSRLEQESGDPDPCRGNVTFKSSKDVHAKTWRGSTFSQSVKDITSQMESFWDEKEDDDEDDEDFEDEEDDDDADDDADED